MEELSADSILAQVDCQNLAVSVGQQTVAASIQVPSSSHTFCSRQLYGAVPGKLTITGHPSAGVPAYPMPATKGNISP